MRKTIAFAAVAVMLATSAIAGNSQTYNCVKQPDENNFSADRCNQNRTGERVSATRAAAKAAKAAAAKASK